MNICYYYQYLLPRPVHELSPAHFNPTGVSALLVYTMIAQGKTCLHALSGTRSGMATPVEPRPFSGLPHSAGELFRTPEQMPASMSTAQLSLCGNTF
jgi:hypothetical protein